MILKHFYRVDARIMVLGLGLLLSFSACKKDTPDNPVDPVDPPSTGSRAELSKDSLFLYAKQVYLWNESLPSYEVFNPRKYTGTDDKDALEKELFAITQIPKNPSTGNSYEFTGINSTNPKYSYIDDISDNNATQSFVPRSKGDVELNGSGFDMGFYWFEPYGTAGNFSFYVTGVYPNSPADKAGLSRGAVINKVNGTAIGSNYNSQYMLVYNIVDGNPTSVTISGTKADGTPFNDVVLTKAKYTTSPVLKAKTITSGSRKIGYLALIHFTTLQSNARTPLTEAFNKFASDGVTDLVIDLRYNGGGYVNTAEYLTNLIAPSTATGVMFKEYYNKTMREGKATILEYQPLLDEDDKVQYQNGKMLTYADIDYSEAENTTNFSKKGTLGNVTNVVFIVSGGTASASELVINSLKPVMNVKLVGETTYGKPVGFFPFRLENKYDVYMSMFETRNAKDEGGYYAGLTPDYPSDPRSVIDDARYDFGDEREGYIKKAISVLAPSAGTLSASQTGKVMSIRGKSMSVETARQITKDAKKPSPFVGMVETRYRLKN